MFFQETSISEGIGTYMEIVVGAEGKINRRNSNINMGNLLVLPC